MSGIINFNAQIAPMEHVEKLVRKEQEHGQVKQDALMQKAGEHLSQEGQLVQKTSESKKGRRVDRRKHGREEGKKDASSFTRKDCGFDGQADDESLAESAQTGVWSGNIVNIKV